MIHMKKKVMMTLEKIKTENWNGHEIRFVNINGKWWVLVKDITSALGYKNLRKAIKQYVENKNCRSLSIKAYGDKLDLKQEVK